jgi:hypothetical protein
MLKAAVHDVPREFVDEFVDRLIESAEPVEFGRLLVCTAIAEELTVST